MTQGYQVVVEGMEGVQWVAHAVDLPGCFNGGATEQEAVAGMEDAIAAYYEWLSQHDSTQPVVVGPYRIEVVERIPTVTREDDPDYPINPFFERDRRPLTHWEVVGGLRMLAWSHAAFQATVATIDDARRQAPIDGEFLGSIDGIIDHVAESENWYFDRLDCGVEPGRLPADPLEKLEVVRANARQQLITFVGDARIVERRGEGWSPRKVLRRTLWHELDHSHHIVQRLAEN